jgi:preprotein translocase subunit SecG
MENNQKIIIDFITQNINWIIILIIIVFLYICFSIIRTLLLIKKYGLSNYFSANGILFGTKKGKELKEKKSE